MAEELDVWSKLPHEVVESILSRLSVYDIVRAGCTCTRLRAFISSHSLLPSFSVSLLLWVHPFDLPSPQEVTPHGSSAWAYDRTRDAWLKISLAFLQPALPRYAYPVASAGGLVCFGWGRDYVVCNAITRSCRRLPTHPPLTEPENGQSCEFAFDFEEHAVQAFGLICNCINDTYEFFIFYYGNLRPERDLRLVHYSSLVSQWRVMPPFLTRKLHKLLSNTITPCNSRLYTLWEKEGSLVVLRHCNGCWAEIKGPDFAAPFLKAFLLDMNGSLHMVAGVGSVWFCEYMWERPTSVHIWELDVESREWMEVTKMPSSVLQEFCRCIDFDELQCWGKNGVMYMKSSRSDVLMCDIGGNEWKWLKDLDVDVDLEGVIFEPSLSAVA